MKVVRNDTLASGRAGEDIAARYLIAKGYVILTRNYRVREGEIDIVAEREGAVVFTEVKWRRSDRFAAPGASVGARKQARLRRAAAFWMAEHGECDARFDVIEIIEGISSHAPRINHIVNAFV